MSTHDASASALGYLYQVKWALLELVAGMVDRADQELSLETLDDVAWSVGGGVPVELLQLKHHAENRGDLSDMSDDLWRTLKVWMDRPSFLDSNGPLLTIVTTGRSPSESAASYLGANTGERREDLAVNALTAAARGSVSRTTQRSREAWLGLTHAEREGLVSRIRVFDGSAAVPEVDQKVKSIMMPGLPHGREDLFLDQLWGWWYGVAVDLLAGRRRSVSAIELHQTVSGIRDKFRSDDLITTVEESRFDDVDLMTVHQDRTFLQQLGWVHLRPRLLQKAVLDYHRAVAQTTEWIDETLLEMAELEVFKRALVDEWENQFEDMLDRLPDTADDEQQREAGRRLYEVLRDSTSVLVRRRYSDPFYSRGIRYEIADAGSHGWHPKFAELLSAATVGGVTK